LNYIKTQPESRREWMLHRFSWNAAQHKRSSNHQLWTHENRPEIIYSKPFFDQKLNYIHQNPVRAGWVERPEDYLYSSAKALMQQVPGQIDLELWR
jgi:hypothetical protein